MKHLLSTLAILSAFSCQTAWKGADLQGSVKLTPNTLATGLHCESSALRNALLYQGYAFTEAHIAGGGGAMGFLYQRGKFPFLGGRSLTMAPQFLNSAEIPWKAVETPEPSQSWRDIASLLEQDTPVVLRVDMRYLPYLYGGKYGSRYMSFGWHIITLFGIDWDSGTAWVSDTAQQGLQQIALKDLHKARYSDCDFLPPRGNYYWVEKAPSDYRTDWSVLLNQAIAEWISNYEAVIDSPSETGGLQGQKELPGIIRTMDEEVPSYMLPVVLSSLYSWIEENGTGGASFRQFTLDYLKDMQQRLPEHQLEQAIDLLSLSVDQWHRLADTFRQAGLDKKGLKNTATRRQWLEQIAEEAEVLYKREEAFYLYLKQRES